MSKGPQRILTDKVYTDLSTPSSPACEFIWLDKWEQFVEQAEIDTEDVSIWNALYKLLDAYLWVIPLHMLTVQALTAYGKDIR